MIRVLVVDDHPVVLAGLTALIEADSTMTVFASATSASEAQSLAEALASDGEPDVCVLDLQLPDGDGISLGTTLKRRWPATRVLVLTMASDPGAVIRTLGAGLDGYLLKDSDPAELRAAIHAAAQGSTVLGRGASGPVVIAATVLPDANPLAALDARDREILTLLVQGLGPSQIAGRLFLAPKTVRNRMTAMLAKLGVTTREDAIALGVAGGLGA
ncbi:MAG: response regulator transcription factor [Actinobacteria bacterium]|nr:response regulator transcription factor [Actinomycetota bacterium]